MLLAGSGAPVAHAQSFQVHSPDETITVTVQADGDRLSYAVSKEGRVLVEPSPISTTLAEGPVLGRKPTVDDTNRRRVERVLRPVVPNKNAEVPDRFRELRIDFEKDFALIVRAYDEDAAYRPQGRRAQTARQFPRQL